MPKYLLRDSGCRQAQPELRFSVWYNRCSLQSNDKYQPRTVRRFQVRGRSLALRGYDHKTLRSGETVWVYRSVIRQTWRIRRYTWRSKEGAVSTASTVYAWHIGWQDEEFETAEDAFEFVEEQIKLGCAPGCPVRPPLF